MDALLGFHGNNGYVNTPQRYILSTITVRFKHTNICTAFYALLVYLWTKKYTKTLNSVFQGKEQHFLLHNMCSYYLLTPWCRVLLEQLTGLQLVKKFPAFHGTRRFITALTSICHLSLSWASPIQSTSHLLEIHPNIIHPSTPRSPQWSPSLQFPQQDSIHPLSSPIQLPLPQGNIPGTNFCQRLSQPQGHSAAGRIMSMKNSNDTIGNRTCDPPVRSAVPQPTAPPCTPDTDLWINHPIICYTAYMSCCLIGLSALDDGSCSWNFVWEYYQKILIFFQSHVGGKRTRNSID